MYKRRKLSEGISARYDGTFVKISSDLGHFICLPQEALDNLVLLRKEINEQDRNEELAKEDGREVEAPYEIDDSIFTDFVPEGNLCPNPECEECVSDLEGQKADFRHAMKLADEAIERTPIGEAIRFEEVIDHD